MRGDTSTLPLVLAALIGGLALFVAGFFIAAEMRSADASPAAASEGALTCFNVDAPNGSGAGDEACASNDATCVGGFGSNDLCAGFNAQYSLNCARGPSGNGCWRCCTVSAGAVGGTMELLPVAGGSASYNYAIAAVLAFVAVVAFAAGGWCARRRLLG